MARYMKIKPANNFLDKYSMKSFEIDSLSVYSEKKIIELHLKINNYNADREIEDLRKLLYKSFGNELTLRVEYDIKPELIRENVIGYVIFNQILDEAEIYKIVVLKDFRKKQIAFKIFEFLLNELKKNNVKKW